MEKKESAGSSNSPGGEKKPSAPSIPAASLKRHAVKEWLRAGSQGQGQLFGDVAERWDGADEEQIAAADALVKESAPKKKRDRDDWDVEYDKGKSKKVKKKGVPGGEEDLSSLFKEARAARGRGGRDGGRGGGRSSGMRGRGRGGSGRDGGRGRGGRGGGRGMRGRDGGGRGGRGSRGRGRGRGRF